MSSRRSESSPLSPFRVLLVLTVWTVMSMGFACTDEENKIGFDLSRLDADGLQGPPDGLRALHYEFCIPAQPEFIEEVTRIDTTLVVHPDAKGRIRCEADEFLCLGNTHQPAYAEVLTSLAQLPYIRVIEESFFEH